MNVRVHEENVEPLTRAAEALELTLPKLVNQLISRELGVGLYHVRPVAESPGWSPAFDEVLDTATSAVEPCWAFLVDLPDGLTVVAGSITSAESNWIDLKEPNTNANARVPRHLVQSWSKAENYAEDVMVAIERWSALTRVKVAPATHRMLVNLRAWRGYQ